LLNYIKKAFFYHWNLLGVATGVALAFISGYPEVVLPALAAMEILYLAVLSSNPRFQDAVIAGENTHQQKRQSQKALQLEKILASLTREDRNRYERLKNLCLELRNIADRVKGGVKNELGGISDVHLNSINHLLWMYLKLLYSKNALESYFKAIIVEDIQNRIERTEQRLEAMGPSTNDRETDVIRRESLADTLKTCHKRLKNYRTARDNYHFIELELERLNSKIASIAEMGINRQDPNLITGEISIVSSAIEQTEKSMEELDVFTNMSLPDEDPPDLLIDHENMEPPFVEKTTA
jgi:hypothetical protein